MITRSPLRILFRLRTFAKRQTSRCSCWKLSARLSPGSPSQRIATLFLVGPFRCRSRQFSETFNFPPSNQRANGAFHFSTLFQRFVQTSSSASRAQNFAGRSIDSRCIRRYCRRLLIRERFAKSFDGLKTRFSIRCDSIFSVMGKRLAIPATHSIQSYAAIGGTGIVPSLTRE